MAKNYMTKEQRVKNLGKYSIKGAKPWNKDKKGVYSEEVIERMKNSQKLRFKTNSPWNKGVMGYTTSLRGKKRPDMDGEKHFAWKGKMASYRAIHIWIQNHYGSLKKCEFCLDVSDHRYHWANISGKYLRVRQDWYRLCPKCHKAYDIGKRKGGV